MIAGSVNANREAVVNIEIHGTAGHTRVVEAVIDTGFTGFLTLPPNVTTALGLTWRGRAQATLGDGRLHPFDVYVATVIWDGHARLVEADGADTTPLIGMGLLYQHDLRIQVVEGGIVSIESIPIQ